ncbi:hypothetical protein CCP3SC1AL1_320025 [Gammaproteobacteria bacterium]
MRESLLIVTFRVQMRSYGFYKLFQFAEPVSLRIYVSPRIPYEESNLVKAEIHIWVSANDLSKRNLFVVLRGQPDSCPVHRPYFKEFVSSAEHFFKHALIIGQAVSTNLSQEPIEVVPLDVVLSVNPFGRAAVVYKLFYLGGMTYVLLAPFLRMLGPVDYSEPQRI